MPQQPVAITPRAIPLPPPELRAEPPLVRDLLVRHFAPAELEELAVTRREFAHWMRPDIQRELELLFAALPECRFYGARIRDDSLDFRFPNLLEAGDGAIAVGPAVYFDIDIGDETPVRCLLRGIWLAHLDNMPFALLVNVDEGYSGTRLRVEIAVPPGADAETLAVRTLKRLDAATSAARSLRGKVLSIEGEKTGFTVEPATVKVQRTAPVSREEIILPAKTLALIERSTTGFVRHLDRLVELGMSPRRGVLFYGPPGVGKTLTVRYLACALPEFTTLIIAAEQFDSLGEYFEMARRLQPAMVVLEDIDLIGADRSGPWANAPAKLNHLLNEMDGLGTDARILFVLTTNRVEVLEPALAGRPGRVDQAIEFGLPDDAERRRLIRRYACALAPSEELAAAASRRMGKVSPAFIKELMRRAALNMMDRGGEALELADLEAATDDMLVLGGSLNANLLGHRTGLGFT
jgi:hypothetical protein